MASLAGYASQFLNGLAANPEAAAATVAGGVTTYVGYTLQDYNKDNFNTDNGQRFARFQQARGNMMSQVGQYRVDLRGFTSVTMNKAHVFMDTAQLFMCTSAALSCAGRLGMHGSAPPGYICALYAMHIFIGAMYLTICLWLGMHSTLRAQCGMVSLLTRKVRLPAPPLWLIDQSRTFASGYEKQTWWDILRFPFVPHPHDAPEIPANSSDEDEKEATARKQKKQKEEPMHRRTGDLAAGSDFKSTGRASVPSWIRDENAIDKGNACVPHHDSDGGVVLHTDVDGHDTPDHFKLYTEAQKEWFPYESYQRIALLYGTCCFFHGITYYCIGTSMSELRGMWIGWATPGLFMAGQYWLLQLDIFKGKGTQFLPNFELFGQIAPYFATAACMCEFRFQYSKAQVGLAWTFALLSLVSHFLFACRFFDLMTPDTFTKEMPDEDGKSWWPRTHWAPLAFAETLWQITPPKKLKKGQHCLLHEAMALESTKAGTVSSKLRRRKGGKEKASKRLCASTEPELKDQVKHLERRLRSVFDQMPIGKGQDRITQFHGRWSKARQEAEKVCGGYGSSGSGSDSSGKEYVKQSMNKEEKAFKIREVADELNAIEDELVNFEQTYDIQDEDIQRSGQATQEDGSIKGLPETPYWIMRIAVGTHIFLCFFVICGIVAEICAGSEAFLSGPGEPPWIRNQKLRYMQPDRSYIHRSNEPLPDWYRLFSSADMPAPAPGHGGGHDDGGHGDGGHGDGGHDSSAPAPHSSGHRRLDDKVTSGAMEELIASLPSLEWLADELAQDNGPTLNSLASSSGHAGLPTSMAKENQISPESNTIPTGFMSESLWSLPIEWPRLFEPQHLACQTRASGTAIAALTPRGVGALLHLKNASDAKAMVAEPFALAGITPHGTVVGSSWEPSGLRLVMNTGLILHCHGHGPTEGAWPCQVDANMPLPKLGSGLKTAAVTEHAAGEHTVAMVFEDMPSTVVLYKNGGGNKEWMPAGEMRLPPGSGHNAGLGFANDMLMIIGADGSVHHRPLHNDAKPMMSPLPSKASASREWHSACAASSDQGVLRLALRRAGRYGNWQPELVVEAQKKKSKVPLVNV